mgnify:CR=1 FL=1
MTAKKKRLLFMVLGVQDVVRDALALEHLRKKLRVCVHLLRC